MRHLKRVQRVAAGIFIAILCGMALAVDVSDEGKISGIDADQYAEFLEYEVFDLEDLAEGAEIQRRMFNRMTPPGFSWIQPMYPSVAPFDATNFSEALLDDLLGETRNTVVLYPLSLELDPKTRETLVYNADGKLIATVPSDESSSSWPADTDPARVILQLDLLPAEDVEPYLYVEDRIAESAISYAKSKPARDGGAMTKSLGSTNFGFCNILKQTNGTIQTTVTNGTDVTEVYAYTVWHTATVVVVTWTNEQSNVVTESNTVWTPVSPAFNGLDGTWECQTTNHVLTNGVGAWVDANIPSNISARFYATARRVDSDSDGLTDGAEIFLHRTNPEVADTDGDGMPDGWEVQYGLNALSGLDDSLVGWWKLDDGAGSLAVNSVTGGYHGDLTGFAGTSNSGWIADGKIGGALRFDGVDDFVEVVQGTAMLTGGPFTVSAWAWLDVGCTSDWPEIVSDYDPTSWDGYCLGFDTNQSPYAMIGYSGWTEDTNTFTDQWVWVVLEYDGTNMCLYRNGELADGPASAGFVSSTNESFMFGNGQDPDYSEHWKGMLDDIRMYSSALGTNGIATLYEAWQDADGDGLMNLDEYLRGLNPLVSDWPGVLYVDGTSGDDETGTGTSNAPFQTLSYAMEVAEPYIGCTVWVASGEYAESVSLCSGVELRAMDSQLVEIQSLSGLNATNVQVSNLTVGTLTLQNSSAVASGIQSDNITATDSAFNLNSSRVEGGGRGLYCTGSSIVEVINCFFSGNQIACQVDTNAILQLLNTVLVRSSSQAVLGDEAGALEINHCVVAYNYWQGVAGEFSGVGISNSVIWNNKVDIDVSGEAQLSHCAFSVSQDGDTNGNIQVSDPGWINTALDNYRLRSDSPLINQGGIDTTLDIDGETRPCGGASDIGPDEMRDDDSDGMADFWEQANNATNPAQDIDADSMTNLEEYRSAFNPRQADGRVQVYVSTNGSDETGTGSLANPFATIGKGVDYASQHGGGTVNISAGDWWGQFSMRDEVTLKGAGADQTKIYPWWQFLYSEYLIKGNRNVGMEDLSLQNYRTVAWGSDGVVFKRVRLKNQLELWALNQATLEDVEVLDSNIPGLLVETVNGLSLNRCHIHNNNGHGIRVYPPLINATVSNTTIVHNQGHGIGIENFGLSNVNMAVRHSVVAFNRDTGIHWNNNPAGASVRNSILWHNGQDLYNLSSTQVQCCNISDQNLGGTGNLFGIWPKWENSAGGNFHLLTNSPMRNQGANLAGHDIDSEPRPVSGATDIGVDQVYYPAGSWFPSNWVAQYGSLSPLADADGDGLTNYEEYRNGTNPNSADTDGDGVSDYQEVWQAGNPTDSSDGGQPPPDDELAYLNLEIGDTSGSLSEKYMLQVGSICLRMTTYGGSTNRIVPFRVGREYDVRIMHLGSSNNPPDLDYVIDISPAATTNDSSYAVYKKDPAGLLNGGDDLAASFFNNDAAIVVLKMNMTAYRPMTEGDEYGEPFARRAVPEDLEENPGAGVRVNGDSDNTGTTPDRDETYVQNENDLIEVVLDVSPPQTSGFNYILKRSNSNIKVFASQFKSTPYFGANLETNLTFSSTTLTVWVECPTGGVSDLSLEARDTNSTVICEDKVRFFSFSSIIIGISGEDWWFLGGDYLDNGMYDIATNLYELGYDIHYYDEDDIEQDGGIAYIEITNAIQRRAISKIALYGHSHGGGSVFYIAERLDNNRANLGQFSIDAAVYVDAIENEGPSDTDSQTNIPPSTAYLANYYETNSATDPLVWYLNGAYVPNADINSNVNTATWGIALDHVTIDASTNIHSMVIEQLTNNITR